jgi:membrane glycosyltransferase
MTGARFSEYGGGGRFSLSLMAEILLAILYAPILMVQQMIAVFRTALGLQKGWSPQARDGGSYSWRTLATCHALETVSGLILWAGIIAGVVSLWLLPIAISLVLAIPLSALSGVPLQRYAKALLATREVYAEPRITRLARARRQTLRLALETAAARRTAAE